MTFAPRAFKSTFFPLFSNVRENKYFAYCNILNVEDIYCKLATVLKFVIRCLKKCKLAVCKIVWKKNKKTFVESEQKSSLVKKLFRLLRWCIILSCRKERRERRQASFCILKCISKIHALRSKWKFCLYMKTIVLPFNSQCAPHIDSLLP